MNEGGTNTVDMSLAVLYDNRLSNTDFKPDILAEFFLDKGLQMVCFLSHQYILKVQILQVQNSYASLIPFLLWMPDTYPLSNPNKTFCAQ